MPNEFGPNIDRYPPEGGRFWLRIDRNSGEWTTTLRTKSDWPNEIGVEVARFNPVIVSKHPQLARLIVDTINVAASAGAQLDLAELESLLQRSRVEGHK